MDNILPVDLAAKNGMTLGYLLPRRGSWGENMGGLCSVKERKHMGNNENGELLYINNLIFL